ncbi:MAG: hypothetical protein ACOC9N_02075 [Gemmatimonadota bacterium]
MQNHLALIGALLTTAIVPGCAQDAGGGEDTPARQSAGADDYRTDPAGAAGNRVACAAIVAE